MIRLEKFNFCYVVGQILLEFRTVSALSDLNQCHRVKLVSFIDYPCYCMVIVITNIFLYQAHLDFRRVLTLLLFGFSIYMRYSVELSMGQSHLLALIK